MAFGSFIDKVVVVTGAGSGMGRAYALEFEKVGAKLALCDIDPVGLQETVDALRTPRDDRVFSSTVDVADEDAVNEFADRSRAALGNAHVVINNAGIAGSMLPGAETSVKDLDRVFAVNFYGVVHGTLAFLPQLEANAEAALVNVSSIFGMIGAPGNADYCATKFAVRGYTEVLMAELDGSHIQVHLVHPGGIDTNIVRGTTAEDDAKALLTTPPAEIAVKVIEAIRRNRRRVVFGNAARPARFVSNFLPVGLVARLLHKGVERGRSPGAPHSAAPPPHAPE
ncbi:MAG: SDR family NAD(P)-dependent oxidoreductase [Acidimicrobiales bacterium]